MIASVGVHGERAIAQALAEIHRVLAVGGIFVFSVPTRRFYDNLLISRICQSLGLSGCAERYARRLDRRLTLYLMWNEDECRAALEESGFHIELIRPFFTPRQAHWWDILKLHIFRVFGILKLINWDILRRFSSKLQERLFKTVIIDNAGSASSEKREQAGYLLVVARKVVTGQGMHSRTH
jgi:SAM-dependent methyltransferase